MNKKIILLCISGLALSACGYDFAKFQNSFYANNDVDSSIPVPTRHDVSLTDIGDVYRGGSVDVYDINKYPSDYADQRQYARPPLGYPINKKIPVKDNNVEVYDISSSSTIENVSAPKNITKQPIDAGVPLSPPSNVKDDFQSPFLIIEEDGMLTDPAFGENTQTSVIVPPAEDNQSQEDDFELMTGL